MVRNVFREKKVVSNVSKLSNLVNLSSHPRFEALTKYVWCANFSTNTLKKKVSLKLWSILPFAETNLILRKKSNSCKVEVCKRFYFSGFPPTVESSNSWFRKSCFRFHQVPSCRNQQGTFPYAYFCFGNKFVKFSCLLLCLLLQN